MSMMYIKTLEISGIPGAMHGMRNPFQSWEKSDTYIVIGQNDLKLAQKLVLAGDEHGKFMRCIHVQADVCFPRYLWSEFDTYRFGTKNSESTMHRLLNNPNPITKDLFVTCEEDEGILSTVITRLEDMRQEYMALKRDEHDDGSKPEKLNRLLVRAKRLLPEGFLQMRTWDTNYQEIRRMYFQRKNHRLKEEWCDVFCRWVESLPYAKELITYTGKKEEKS